MNRKNIFKYKKVNKHLYRVATKSGLLIGEFIQDADGYFYFFLNDYNGGALSSEILSELSNKLNKINYVHNNKINECLDVKKNNNLINLIIRLRRFQDWRRGKIDLEKDELDPEQIGYDIDTTIGILKWNFLHLELNNKK